MRNRLFNSIRIQVPKSNVFDLSHEKKLSCNMGELIPIYVQEVLPRDKFRANSEVFVRLAPMVAPMMHRVNVYVHFFFVPNRLIWTNWENFITGGVDGLNASVHPYFPVNATRQAYFYDGGLPDYLGCPDLEGITLNNAVNINSLPFRAYQLIYNTYYRDQTLDTEITIPKTDGSDAASFAELLTLRTRCWEKDYFTSALTDTQRGGDVMLPGTPHYLDYSDTKDHLGNVATDAAHITSASGHLNSDGVPNPVERIENLESYDIAINDLRTAGRLQEWLEKQARGGSRYIETILSHFGIYGKDSRFQRPEYLGGGKQPVIISEVLNTSDTATAPQGNMAGHGVSVGKTNSFKRSFDEHGWILGILSVLPRTAYQQGFERHWFKSDKYSYAWPSLANLGEQPVYYKEIMPEWTNADNNDTAFGYQSRYAEYKFKQSSVHGDFKDSLYHWHMGRIFAAQPSLNNTFVDSDPTHRVFAVTTSTVDKLYIQIYNNVQAIRALPKYGTPRL